MQVTNFSYTFLVLSLVTFLQNAADASPCNISDKATSRVAANTFKIIPIKQALIDFEPAQAKSYVEQLCHRPNLPVSEKLNCEIMKACKPESCAPIYGAHGTAFLGSDGQTLHSAWHVLFSTHEVALQFLGNYLGKLSTDEKKRAYASLGPTFILLDHQDKIVYDSRSSHSTRYKNFGDPLTPIYVQQGTKDKKPFGYFENIREDYVSIDLGTRLGAGLPLAKQNAHSDCYFGAGFIYDGVREEYNLASGRRESVTELKKRTGLFLEALLMDLPLSRNNLGSLSTEDILHIFGYSQDQVAHQIKIYSDSELRSSIDKILIGHERHLQDLKTESDPSVLFLSMPVFNGQSGGPLINEDGEVLGILTNAFLTNEHGAPRSHGAGARLF